MPEEKCETKYSQECRTITDNKCETVYENKAGIQSRAEIISPTTDRASL